MLAVFAALTALAALAAARYGGVYWTRVEVVMLAPATIENQNSLRSPTESLIDFTALVERQFNGNLDVHRFSDPSGATLYGAGVTAGYTVSLVNGGGQWSNSFTQPVLDVQVVGSSPADVKARLGHVVARIDAIVKNRQRDASVPTTQFVTTLQSPAPAAISHIKGNRLRAVAGVAALGAVLGICFTIALDRVIIGRSRRRLARDVSAGQV